MTHALEKHRLFVLVVLFPLVMLAAYSVAAQDTATPEPDVSAEATSEPIEATFGPGDFNLMTPTAGLSRLTSYRATLTLSFDGTNEGQAEQWSRTYTMLVTQTPPSRQLTIDKSEDAAGQVYMAEVNGTFYERQDANGCVASAIEAEGAFAERWEPAGFLDSVIGADEAGTETVNDIAADHYTFDESAQGASGTADSTGEMWIASDGDYLVRFTLVTTGSADYFGEGIEGTITWDYELSDINAPLVVELPEDCPPGLLDVPTLPDAADVVRLPGFTSYNTASSLEDAVAFYEEQVSALGGQPANPPLISESGALFGFTQGDQAILVNMSAGSGGTSVAIYSMEDSAELAFTAEVPDASGAPAVVEQGTTSGDCAAAADTIPMLPDATDVQSLPGVISYMTPTSVADATTFYEEQVAALGGQVSSPMPASDMMAMLEVRQGDQVLMVTIVPVGGTTNVTITSASMNPLAPPAPCDAPEPVATQAGTASDASTAACTVSTGTSANQRSGPGTTFEVAGTLAGGTSAAVDGQATGADGFVWWRLGEGIWVRSDVVNATGDCDGVPVVQP